jgi:phosphopantetheinyl transferase (holo-ACP synthase)
MTVRTAIETFPIPSPGAAWDALDAAAFSPAEREEAEALPARTAAGRLALKRAVRALLEELSGASVPLDAIRVRSGAGGRPEVSLAEGADERAAEVCRRVRASISHSRRTALGAAAAEEEGR